MKAAEAKFGGKTGSYEGCVKKLLDKGFTNNDIVTAVDKIIEEKLREPELDESTMPAAKELYNVKDLKDQYKAENVDGFNNVRRALIEQGKTESNLNKTIREIIAEQLDEGTLTDAQAAKKLTIYAGMTEEEADTQINTWNFNSMHPTSSLDNDQIKTYYEEIAPQGISVKVYEQYYNATKDAEGSTKKAQVLAAIDALPISNEQKDTFYYFAGYKSSRIYEAPWH